MKRFFPLLALLLTLACARPKPASQPAYDETNSVYYWKTVFNPSDTTFSWLDSHDVGRIYLRMFDVVPSDASWFYDATVPNASVRFDSDLISWNDSLCPELAAREFVPVVYVTLEALKAEQDSVELLARNIVTRVHNMTQYNCMHNVKELQLDCDWTMLTEESFFKLCEAVRVVLHEQEIPWELSSTIRLHQLARQVPPVDRGVLMVYNTGSFNDPDEANSIISLKNVEPYLKHLEKYPLHLDVAYPTYSWQLLFRNRQFIGLLNGVNLADTTKFAPRGPNLFEAKRDIPYSEMIIRRGDVIRQETSEADEIMAVKTEIEKKLGGRSHSNILYHLDDQNLSNYTTDEIDRIYSTAD